MENRGSGPEQDVVDDDGYTHADDLSVFNWRPESLEDKVIKTLALSMAQAQTDCAFLKARLEAVGEVLTLMIQHGIPSSGGTGTEIPAMLVARLQTILMS